MESRQHHGCSADFSTVKKQKYTCLIDYGTDSNVSDNTTFLQAVLDLPRQSWRQPTMYIGDHIRDHTHELAQLLNE